MPSRKSLFAIWITCLAAAVVSWVLPLLHAEELKPVLVQPIWPGKPPGETK